MAEPCTHGMPTPASCVDCMYDGNLTPPSPTGSEATPWPAFEAIYDGDCPACGHIIHAGQQIRRTTLGRYVHDGCTP